MGQLGAQRRRQAPAQAARGREAEIAAGPAEAHHRRVAAELGEQDRVLGQRLHQPAADEARRHRRSAAVIRRGQALGARSCVPGRASSRAGSSVGSGRSALERRGQQLQGWRRHRRPASGRDGKPRTGVAANSGIGAELDHPAGAGQGVAQRDPGGQTIHDQDEIGLGQQRAGIESGMHGMRGRQRDAATARTRPRAGRKRRANRSRAAKPAGEGAGALRDHQAACARRPAWLLPLRSPRRCGHR